MPEQKASVKSAQKGDGASARTPTNTPFDQLMRSINAAPDVETLGIVVEGIKVRNRDWQCPHLVV